MLNYRCPRVLIVILSLFVGSSSAIAQQDRQKAHDNLLDILKRGEISRVTVLHVRTDLETRTRIDEKMLRNLSPIEISFTKLQSRGFLDGLESALVEIQAAKSSTSHELRWGLLFVDASGKERGSVFIDSTGRFLLIGQSRFEVQGSTLSWIKRTIQEALK